jgi:hypothetical protein
MRELDLRELSLVSGAGAIGDAISTTANAMAIGAGAGAIRGMRGGVWGAAIGGVIGAAVGAYEAITDDGSNYSGTNYN